MDLSVMFFGAEGAGSGGAADVYDDVLALAEAADALGFTAVWTPERHFQRFGQAFPAPAVLGAALAARTSRLEIRAGSAVLPLKHPLRTVEEWSVLDNLSRGRVGLSVAAGWHSTDFVLAPGAYAERREDALAQIGLIRRLWAGEEFKSADGLGESVAVRPRPEPYRRSLPLWLTSSGSERGWRDAGRLRTGVLAAAPGQSRAELAEKIALYRAAYEAAPAQLGSGERGTVTLMVHAYAGESPAQVRAKVRDPLKDYFKAYFRQTSSSKAGAGEAALPELTAAQTDTMAEFAFERYLAWGSLLGTPERCWEMMADFDALGCDELACLVDFGLDRADIIASMRRLAQVRDRLAARREGKR